MRAEVNGVWWPPSSSKRVRRVIPVGWVRFLPPPLLPCRTSPATRSGSLRRWLMCSVSPSAGGGGRVDVRRGARATATAGPAVGRGGGSDPFVDGRLERRVLAVHRDAGGQAAAGDVHQVVVTLGHGRQR